MEVRGVGGTAVLGAGRACGPAEAGVCVDVDAADRPAVGAACEAARAAPSVPGLVWPGPSTRVAGVVP